MNRLFDTYLIGLIISCLMVFSIPVFSQNEAELNIIPRPNHMEVNSGYFFMDTTVVIVAEDSLLQKAKKLKFFLEPALGFDIPIAQEVLGKKMIKLTLNSQLSSLGKEGYRFMSTEDQIIISGFDPTGVYWGIQTLRQLLPSEILREAKVDDVHWKVPKVFIEDKPRFDWRGLMVDYSRTFWNIQQTKKYIDILSFYKMNILHMHLTDDQGWRLEMQLYPELTQKAAYFAEEFNEPEEREGFYTQADIRELIAYAHDRNVNIVPEIEMPGHTAEVFAAFPELSCDGDTFMIHPYFEGPGIHEEILCAGNDLTFEFLENILSEVITLFPFDYLHIGGDEAPKKRWEACLKCQNRILKEGLKDEHELQSWFIKRIDSLLYQRGKKLIGWNEILEGGLAPNAAVMFWAGDLRKTLEAATKGHKIVMSPTSHCYFDYTYDRISTQNVYDYDPVDSTMDTRFHPNILGLQANFWSHIDRDVPSMDRQIFPRLIALAEVGWTRNENKNWNHFSSRLSAHYIPLKNWGLYMMKEP